MANKTEILVMEMGDAVAEKLDMSVVDVQFVKESGVRYLRIFIDKDGGVGVDDCEVFSRALGDELDSKDPIDEEYVLEVSSPGVDRKLKTEREFKHYLGREVDVKLFKADENGKEFSGVLTDYEDKVAVIEADGEKRNVNIKDAAYIKLHFEF